MLLFALKHIFIYCIHAGTSTLMDTFFMKKKPRRIDEEKYKQKAWNIL